MYLYIYYIYIYKRSSTIEKLELNESTRRNVWLSKRDTSPWRATNSEECDVVWWNKYYVFLHASPLFLKTMEHHNRAR